MVRRSNTGIKGVSLNAVLLFARTATIGGYALADSENNNRRVRTFGHTKDMEKLKLLACHRWWI